MADPDNFLERIEKLDNKQACHIVKCVTQDIYANLEDTPSFDTLADQIGDLASEAGVQLNLASSEEWYATEFSTDDSGPIAKLLLENLGVQPELERLISGAMDRYTDETLDLGIISAGVAIGFIYIAIASDINVDLGWCKVVKKGLPPEQQKEVAVKTLSKVAEVFMSRIF